MICKVCTHPDRDKIDKLLINGHALRKIADQFKLSYASVRRHKMTHIPAKLSKSHDAETATKADALLADLLDLRRRALAALDQAESMIDLRATAPLLGQARQVMETLLEVRGELDRKTTVTVTMDPEWHRLKTQIMNALEPYPEAKQAVIKTLQESQA